MSKDQAQHVGVAPRAAKHVFGLIAASAAANPLSSPDRFDYEVRLQLVEIYNVSPRLLRDYACWLLK